LLLDSLLGNGNLLVPVFVCPIYHGWNRVLRENVGNFFDVANGAGTKSIGDLFAICDGFRSTSGLDICCNATIGARTSINIFDSASRARTSKTIVDKWNWDFKVRLSTCGQAVKIVELPRGNTDMNNLARDNGGGGGPQVHKNQKKNAKGDSRQNFEKESSTGTMSICFCFFGWFRFPSVNGNSHFSERWLLIHGFDSGFLLGVGCISTTIMLQFLNLVARTWEVPNLYARYSTLTSIISALL
jgi:hypothetical protein